MFSQNQVQHLMIGKASVSLTAGAIKPAAMAVGEIGAFTKGGTKYIESASAPGLPFVLYKKMADGTLLKSDVLSLSNVTQVIRKVGTAATEKLEFYGYNGTSGSIEALDENFYRVHLSFNEGFATNNHGTQYIKHAIYESDASATQAEIAIGLAKSGNANMDREIRNSIRPVIYKAICNTAASATNDFLGAITFVKGSKVVYSVESSGGANDAAVYAAATALAVGDFIRVAPTAAATDLATDNATTRAYDVYKVTAITGGSTAAAQITLDRPVMIETVTYADTDDAAQVIPAATGVAADWGVAVAGQAQTALTSQTVGKIADVVIDWFSTIEGAGITNYTSSTTASTGINTADQIAQLEWFCQGNEGNFYRKGQPYINDPRFEVESTVYETIDIVYNDAVNGLIGAATNRKVLTIALPTTNPDFWTNGTDGLADVLGDLLTGAPMYGGITTNNGGAMVAGDLD